MNNIYNKLYEQITNRTKVLLEKSNMFFLRKGYEKKIYIKKLEMIKKIFLYRIQQQENAVLSKNVEMSKLFFEICNNKAINKHIKKYQKIGDVKLLINIFKLRNQKAKEFGYKNFNEAWNFELKAQNINVKEINNFIKNNTEKKENSKTDCENNTQQRITLSETKKVLKNTSNNLLNELEILEREDAIYELNQDDYVGGYCVYLPVSNKYYIINNFSNDIEKNLNIVHELGHVIRQKQIEDFEFLDYVFKRDLKSEVLPFVSETCFLREVKKNRGKKWKEVYDVCYKENFSNLKYLLFLYEFEKGLYKTKNLTFEFVKKLWENNIKRYIPHQKNNEDFTIYKYFQISNNPFDSFSYLVGRYYANMLLNTEALKPFDELIKHLP